MIQYSRLSQHECYPAKQSRKNEISELKLHYKGQGYALLKEKVHFWKILEQTSTSRQINRQTNTTWTTTLKNFQLINQYKSTEGCLVLFTSTYYSVDRLFLLRFQLLFQLWRQARAKSILRSAFCSIECLYSRSKVYTLRTSYEKFSFIGKWESKFNYV